MRVVALVVALAGCATPASTPALREDPGSFDLDVAELRRRGVANTLLERLTHEPYAYFRMLAEPFEHRVCAEFADVIPGLPMVAVEGDAHLEQFAVTETSFGLDDFDRGGFGPFVVDLVRYAASIHLACAHVEFPCDANAAIKRMLDAYRAALVSRPPTREPAVVARLRARAPTSRAEWMDELERSISRLDVTAERDVRQLWSDFVRISKTATNDIVALGRVHTGIGSATAPRVLLRVRGASDEPDDDLVIELRRGIEVTHPSCVWRGPPNETVALVVMSILRREMPAVHGFVLGTSHAWLQSWSSTYVELSLADLTSQLDLDEVVIDAAEQLATRGSAWYPEPVRASQQASQLIAFDRTRGRVEASAATFAAEVTAAWKRFTKRTSGPPARSSRLLHLRTTVRR